MSPTADRVIFRLSSLGLSSASFILSLAGGLWGASAIEGFNLELTNK